MKSKTRSFSPLERNFKTITIFFYCVFLFLFLFVPAFSYSQEAQPNSPSKKKLLRVGYTMDRFSDVSLKDVKVALDLWGEKADVKNEFNYQTVIFNDLDSAMKAVRANELEMVNLTTTDYLKMENPELLEPAFVPIQGQEPEEVFIVLVRSDGNINRLEDLKGRQVITEFGGRAEIPLMWLDTLLLKEGLGESRDFFGGIKMVDKSSQAVMPVFFKQVDACITATHSFEVMVELNPQLGKELKILLSSPKILSYFSCFRSSLDEEIKKRQKEMTLNLGKTIDGRQILILMQINGVSDFKSSYFEGIRALVKEYNELKAKTKVNEK